MKPILLISLTFFLLSCNNGNESSAGGQATADGETVHGGARPTGVINEKPFVLAGCYEMTMKRDTARLDLQVADSIVSGTLVYHWAEKDWNEGSLRGVIRDSLIIADYTFQSEGMTSTRQEVFRIEDSTLVLAFGDIREENKKWVFSNLSRLQFLETTPFMKVPCTR